MGWTALASKKEISHNRKVHTVEFWVNWTGREEYPPPLTAEVRNDVTIAQVSFMGSTRTE